MERASEMLDSSNDCPTDLQWKAFDTGRIDEQTLKKLSRHLSTCQPCLELLERISSSRSRPLFHGTLSPFLDEENFLRLEVRLRQIQVQSEPSIKPDNQTDESTNTDLPEMLGRFEVKGVLGAGGFGRVYMGYDPLLKRSVAIKAPKRTAFGTESDLSSFLTEARHVAALDHPNIVPIYDVLGDESGRTLIVMKYVSGQPLSSLIRQAPLSLENTVQRMITVSRAVHFAHERGFVHRDLKPSNIMIDDHGEPHVTDFGLVMNLTEDESSNVGRGGTPPYMSPEQVRHDVLAIDRRSDIWALGIILAELVHGRRPFPQKNRDALFRAIQNEDPFIESAKETAELDRIVKRCLTKSPQGRYATADEFAVELQNWHKRHFPKGANKWMYGWRRNTVAVSVMMIVCLGLFFSVDQTNRTASIKKKADINTTLYMLATAPPDQIPNLVRRLLDLGAIATDISSHPRSKSGSDRWKLDLASLVLSEPNVELAEQLAYKLGNEKTNEISAAIKTLDDAASKSFFVDVVSKRLLAEPSTRPKIALSALLCGLDKQHKVLAKLAKDTANSIVNLPEEELLNWLPLFDEIGKSQLVGPLSELMYSEESPEETRRRSTIALAWYLADNLESMSDMLSKADTYQIPILVGSLEPNREEAIPILLKRFRSRFALTRDAQIEDDARPTQPDEEMARLAIGLWMLGEPDAGFDTFGHDPDPTLQSLTIHGLKDQVISIDGLVEQLALFTERTDKRSCAIKFGLLQTLSLVPPKEQNSQLQAIVSRIYSDDPDPGVHSSARLVASKHQFQLAPLDVGTHGGWLVARVGECAQDFVIINPCLAEMGIQNVERAKLLTIPWTWHTRYFPRKIAISMDELTIEQYLQINPIFQSDVPNFRDAEPKAAMILFDLDSAYQFCNLLSEAAGLETCYELEDSEGNASTLVPKPNHLDLLGYRLPTDGEWELACRAGTITSRYFGNLHEVARSYGWIYENNENAKHNKKGAMVSQEVANFLPNRWGLFDIYGNANEICDLSVAPSTDGLTKDGIGGKPVSYLREAPLLRGVSFDQYGYSFAAYARSHCRTNSIKARSIHTVGLRLARTLAKETTVND